MQKRLVFISCGQVTSEERDLGTQIKAIVDRTEVFEAYFAENQSTLQGLTDNIFAQIDQCFGMVCVLHARGEVVSFDGTYTRASVWIEQEIAIGAFLSTVYNKPKKIRIYSQRGIKAEGLRDKLLLNPKEFDDGAEVLTDLSDVLQTWAREIPPLAKTEGVDLDALEDELRENEEILSLDLSNFQSCSDEEFRRVRRQLLKVLPPNVIDVLKLAYLDVGNYNAIVSRVNNIQSYGARANDITMYLGPAKEKALLSVTNAIRELVTFRQTMQSS